MPTLCRRPAIPNKCCDQRFTVVGVTASVSDNHMWAFLPFSVKNNNQLPAVLLLIL